MKVSADELIEFFEIQYGEEEAADNIKKGIKENMKSFSEENEMNIKALNTAYALYKKYKSGKYTSSECDEISELSGVVDSYFSTEGI